MLRADALTERQTQILDGVAAGRSNSIIADDLGITLDGVKWHVSELLGELNLANRRELTAWWVNERSRLSPRATAMFGAPTLWEWLRSLFAPAAKAGAVLAVAAALAAGIYFIATRGGGGGDNAYVEYIDPSIDPARVAAVPRELSWREIVSTDLQGGYFEQDMVLDIESGTVMAPSTVPRPSYRDLGTRFLAWTPSGAATFAITRRETTGETPFSSAGIFETAAIFVGKPGQRLQRVALLPSAKLGAWSADGDLLAVENRIIDLRVGSALDVREQGSVSALLWSPDSSHLVVAGGDVGFALWRRRDGAVGTFDGVAPHWSADSKRLGFVFITVQRVVEQDEPDLVLERTHVFNVLDIDSRTVGEVRRHRGSSEEITWSPSLASVAFMTGAEYAPEVSTIVLSLNQQHEDWTFTAAMSPVWIDDESLVLQGDRCFQWSVFIAGVDGSLHALTDRVDEERFPYPSRDGRLVSYERIKSDGSLREALVVRIDDGAVLASTAYPISVDLLERRPASWSPGSNHLAVGVPVLMPLCEAGAESRGTTVAPFDTDK